MPVSPTPDESYYWEIALAYRDAELAMLEQIKNRLLKGQTLDDQAWATARLAEIQTLRRENTAVLRRVNTSMASKIAGSMGNAYKDGELAALKDTKAYLPERPSAITSQARRASVAAIAREVTGGVATASSGVLRQAEDKYREVVQRVVTSTATGAVDRRTATDQALKAALGAGLKTGPDSRMSLESYIEMATRTGVAKAMIEGHTEAMAANGIDLVYIHPGPRACEICDIWGNTVLWREGGPTGMVIVESMVGDGTVEVHVSGSLSQARGAGWGHPNCRCSIGGYIPGATELPVNRPPWDQEGYEAQQRQREIERHIRDWKRKAALATDPKSLAEAKRKVEQWQAAQRAHMASNPFLKRQYGREGGGSYKLNQPKPTPTTSTLNGKDYRSMTAEERAEAGRIMHGTGAKPTASAPPKIRVARAQTQQEYLDNVEMLTTRYKIGRGGATRLDEDYDEVVEVYASAQGYSMNKLLRGQNPTRPVDSREELLAQAKYLANAIRNTYSTDDRMYLRTGRGDFGLGDADDLISGELIGQSYVDRGFTSTSWTKNLTERPYMRGNFSIRVLVPEGSGAAFAGDNSLPGTEQEVILPPNTKFTIVDAFRDPKTGTLQLTAVVDPRSTH